LPVILQMRALCIATILGLAHGLVGHAHVFAIPSVSLRSVPVMTPTTDAPAPRIPGTRAVRFTGAATVGAVRVTGKATRKVAASFARPFRRSRRAATPEMDERQQPVLEVMEEIPVHDAGRAVFETRADYGEFYDEMMS